MFTKQRAGVRSRSPKRTWRARHGRDRLREFRHRGVVATGGKEGCAATREMARSCRKLGIAASEVLCRSTVLDRRDRRGPDRCRHRRRRAAAGRRHGPARADPRSPPGREPSMRPSPLSMLAALPRRRHCQGLRHDRSGHGHNVVDERRAGGAGLIRLLLVSVVDETFNISIDGRPITSDTVVLLANGAGAVVSLHRGSDGAGLAAAPSRLRSRLGRSRPTR